MNYEKKVKEWFYEAVKKSTVCPAELRSSLLKRHPNVELYLKKLTKEIMTAQSYGTKVRGRPFNIKHIQELVFDMTDIFIKGLVFEATKKYESDLARIARETKIQEQKDLEATVEGNSQGVFAEMGVVFNEKAVGKREEKKI